MMNPKPSPEVSQDWLTGQIALYLRMAIYPLCGWIASMSEAIRWNETTGELVIDVDGGATMLAAAIIAFAATVLWSRKAKAKGGAT